MDKHPKFSAIKLSSNKRYLITDKNEPFFWLADTWWYGMTSRMPIPIFERLAKLRAKQGFNIIQIVIGIPPETKHYDMPLDHAYFKKAEKKLNILWKNNLIPCIVGGWGHHPDILGMPQIISLWEEILKQVKNKPAVLCLCGEVDIFPNTSRLFKKLLLKNRLRKWGRVARFIKEQDRDHLLTVHIQSQTSARKLFGNPNWLDINSIQSGHSLDRAGFMGSVLNEESKKNMPIINLEPWYEGILDNFNDYYQRMAFWLCILSGAKGHSYGAHGIWQMSNNDNFMGHWGKSDWKKSIDFPGAVQLGKSAKLLQNYDWWRISPHLKIINPSWSNNKPYNPMAATIGDEHVFVYFPNINLKQEFTVLLPHGNVFFGISWINTRTLTIIKTEKYKGKLFDIKFPNKVTEKDILCILSVNK